MLPNFLELLAANHRQIGRRSASAMRSPGLQNRRNWPRNRLRTERRLDLTQAIQNNRIAGLCAQSQVSSIAATATRSINKTHIPVPIIDATLTLPVHTSAHAVEGYKVGNIASKFGVVFTKRRFRIALNSASDLKIARLSETIDLVAAFPNKRGEASLP